MEMCRYNLWTWHLLHAHPSHIIPFLRFSPFFSSPCGLMQLMPEHKAAGWKTPIWDVYREIVNEAEGKKIEFHEIERFAFYEEAKKAYAVVSTGEVNLLFFIIRPHLLWSCT